MGRFGQIMIYFGKKWGRFGCSVLVVGFQCLLHLNMYIWLNPDFLSDECPNEYDVTLAKTTHVDAQQSQDIQPYVHIKMQ
jgi:hypothetical protein